MDSRLFEAARTGKIDKLHQLLIENPLLLHTTTLFTTYNPLHIASISGHVDFTNEILRLKPDFAAEINEDGLSPMHMAAANGHLEIVKALMKVDTKLCRIEGREKMTPLHYAAIKGKADVVKEMFLGCKECVDDVTVQKETALYLAVKNNKFLAAQVMIGLLREMKRDDVLNMKDESGNSVLHLASSRKQRLVIELLVGDETHLGSLEINTTNKNGLTALDLLRMFPSEAGDREIQEILKKGGATTSNNIATASPANGSTCILANQSEKELINFFKFKKGRDSPNEARTALLVVASLVATATFQAGLSPPSGTWQDSSVHQAGWSIMGTNNGIVFTLFVLFNSVGFTVSLSMINILTENFPLQFGLQVCMLAMYFSYNTAMTSIAPDSVKTYAIVITSVLSAVAPKLTRLLERPLHKFADFIEKMTRKLW